MKLYVTGTRGIPDIMGGVETHCEELFPRIASKGVDVTVVRRLSYVHDSLHEWHGVKLLDIKTPKKKSLEAIIHTFRAVLAAKSNGADVIHIQAIGPALMVPFAKMLGMKVVFTHHGPDYDRDKWGLIAKNILKLGEFMGTKFADEVIVISNVIKQLLESKYHRTDCHLIYNGVPEPDFCDYPEYFNCLGIQKQNYILGMCRFVPEKNLHHLVEAFARIKTESPELFTGEHPVRLVLAGDTDFEDDYSIALKKSAIEQGIVLTGFVKGRKLHSLLTNAKCYVLPSSHEGLPIALLEAMSYNLPVVVSDIPANKEVGLPDTNYFHVGDIKALAEKLRNVVNKPAMQHKYDMSKYNWDAIADQVISIYKEL